MFQPNHYRLSRTGLADRPDHATLPLAWARSNVVFISRALCAFERIRSNPDIAPFKRRKAAELQARLNSPFDNPGLYLANAGSDFVAWTWDADAFEKTTGFPTRFGVPESAGLVLDDGVHLLRSIDGFEGCLVKGGTVVQSRWWPNEPTASDWRLFLANSNDHYSEADIPHTPVLGFNAERLNETRSAQPLLSRIGQLPVKTQLSWLSILVLPLAAFIGLYLMAATFNNARLDAQVERLEVKLADKRATANQLRRAQTRLNAYTTLGDNVPYILPLSVILEKIDGVEGRPRSVRIFDNQLEFIFSHEADDFDPVTWVRTLENNSLLSDVSISPGVQRSEWVIDARVETQRALAGVSG